MVFHTFPVQELVGTLYWENFPPGNGSHTCRSLQQRTGPQFLSMKRDDVSRVIYFHGLSLSCLVLKAVESAKKYVTGCDQQWSQFSVVEKGTEAWMTVASSAAVCDKGFIPVWPASIRNFTVFFSLRGQLFSILEWRWQVVRGRVPWRLKVRSIHCTSIVTLWWTSIM